MGERMPDLRWVRCLFANWRLGLPLGRFACRLLWRKQARLAVLPALTAPPRRARPHRTAEVVAHTHYLPRHWRGRAHTREVQQEFQALFQVGACSGARWEGGCWHTPWPRWGAAVGR